MAKSTVIRRIARLRGLRRVRDLAQQNDGATAVEFALVLSPFLALLFAIIETATVFFAGQALETATADSARLIMTGQAQNQSFNQAKFKTEVCNRLIAMFDCANSLYVDVRNYQAFASADLSNPIDGGGNLVKNFTYQPGNPRDIVVVRVMYEWPVWLSAWGFDLANMSNGKRLLLATAAFRNEPY